MSDNLVTALEATIERLQQENARYRKVLEEAQVTIAFDAKEYDGLSFSAALKAMAGDLRKTKAALSDFSGYLKSIRAHILTSNPATAVARLDEILKLLRGR